MEYNNEWPIMQWCDDGNIPDLKLTYQIKKVCSKLETPINGLVRMRINI